MQTLLDHHEVLPRERALIEIGRFLQDNGYVFSTVTPATQARVLERPTSERAVDLRGIFGWSLPFAPQLLPDSIIDQLYRAEVLTLLENNYLKSKVRFSTLDNSMFVHSAFPTVESDSVFFGPDTARFVASVNEYLQRPSGPINRVADIGCGSGAGGIAIARQCPTASVMLLDINKSALSASRVNAALNGTRNVVTLQSDLLTATEGTFDLIVANPPYLVDRAKRAYRHGGGSFGEGLSLRILTDALTRLSARGTLLLYTGSAVINGIDTFSAGAQRTLAEHGISGSYREIDPDVFGEELERPEYATADRIAAVVLTVTRS